MSSVNCHEREQWNTSIGCTLLHRDIMYKARDTPRGVCIDVYTYLATVVDSELASAIPLPRTVFVLVGAHLRCISPAYAFLCADMVLYIYIYIYTFKIIHI